MLPIVARGVLQLIKLSDPSPSHTPTALIFIYYTFFFFYFNPLVKGGVCGELWDAEGMLEVVGCFKFVRVFRWMNVESLSGVRNSAGPHRVLL